MSYLQMVSLKLQVGLDPDVKAGKAELFKMWQKNVAIETAARLAHKEQLEREEAGKISH